MNLVEPELEGLVPKSSWSRRGFVMTSLATGFALSITTKIEPGRR